jgi:riboflavin synthase
MFTGIIEEIGRVAALTQKGRLMRLVISTDKVCSEVKVGDSISVDGVCLTAVNIKDKDLAFDCMSETIQATTLKNAHPGTKVNLERALKAGDRIGGHFVTGHVDTTGIIRSRRIFKGNCEYQIGVGASFLKYLLPKGSVAVDGISLTIAAVRRGCFCINIIPHTAQVTALGQKHTGDKVNVEFDILAKSSRSNG